MLFAAAVGTDWACCFLVVVFVFSLLPVIMAMGGVNEGQRSLCYGPKDVIFYRLVRHCGMASLGLFRLFGHF
jgi:hypothetical protein